MWCGLNLLLVGVVELCVGLDWICVWCFFVCDVDVVVWCELMCGDEWRCVEMCDCGCDDDVRVMDWDDLTRMCDLK